MLRIEKLNRFPIEVQWEVENPEELEYDEYIDLRPCFYWKEKRYFLDEVILVHKNRFIKPIYPSYIHGLIVLGFDDFFFIEVIHGLDDYVNIYNIVDTEDED